jgi:hypothetical protein
VGAAGTCRCGRSPLSRPPVKTPQFVPDYAKGTENLLEDSQATLR